MKLTLALILFPLLLEAQIQIGDDINGDVFEGYFGDAVSLSADGEILAIGAPWSNLNGEVSGHVNVYKLESESWQQISSSLSGNISDQFGWSLSLSSDGSILAVGAPSNDANGIAAGAVRVYQNQNDDWIQLGTDIQGANAYDKLGYSVCLSSDGSRLAVAAPFNNTGGFNSGMVQVHQLINENWQQIGNDIIGFTEEEESGFSISLSSDGNTLAIGAPKNNENGALSGQVKVFELTGENWQQIGSDLNGDSSGDQFGYSVSLSSNGFKLAIGAVGNDGNGDSSGQTKVYEWNSGNWIQVGDDISGESVNDFSGIVDLSDDGNILAVGATGNDGNGSLSGHTRVFQLQDEVWTQIGIDIDGEPGDQSGKSISLSTNSRIAIGAPFNDTNNMNAGQVRVFQFATLSSNEISDEHPVKIYPNPATDYLNIQLPSRTENELELSVIDNLGRVVDQKIIAQGSAESKQYQLNGLQNGVYTLIVKYNTKTLPIKFIKQD